MRRGTWCSPPLFFWPEEIVVKTGVETAPTVFEDIITHMKITEARLRSYIREELIREQQWKAEQQLLREGFLDNIKSIYQKIISKPQPADEKKKSDSSSAMSETAKKLSNLAAAVEGAQEQVNNVLNTSSLGEASEKIETFMFKGLGSLSQTKYDLKLLEDLFEKVADVIDENPEQAKKMILSTIQGKMSQGGSENLSLDAKTSKKNSEAFAEVASIFSKLAQKVSSDTNVLQTSLPSPQDNDQLQALGLAHAALNGFIQGGLGALGQTSKDLMMLSSIFSAASKTIDNQTEETQKKMLAVINSKLGKATSSG